MINRTLTPADIQVINDAMDIGTLDRYKNDFTVVCGDGNIVQTISSKGIISTI